MTASKTARRVALVPALIIAGLLVLAFALPCAAGCSPPEAAAECCDAETCGCVDCECDEDSKCRGCDGSPCDVAQCDTDCCEDECPCDPCECYPCCECAGQTPTPICCGPAMAGEALLFDKSDDGKTIYVRGNPDALVGFLNRYQDALWPETENGGGWRTHENGKSVVEGMKRFEEDARQSGKTAVAVYDDITRKAFVEAIR